LDFQPRIAVCRGKTGNIITVEQQILNRWIECFEERLNSNGMQPLNAEAVFFGPELHIPAATATEVYGAIRRTENNMAPAEDAVTAKLINKGGRCLLKNIYQLILYVWEKEIMPKRWQTSTICTIYIKGNKSECEK
jgi:hypothetical protein